MNFEKWCASKGYEPRRNGSLYEAWQAAERAALERAAQVCEQEASDSKRHRLHEYAAGANICADAIRALIEQDDKENGDA